MGTTCGIVGLPNAGKSTLFNALTAAAAVAESYPFSTIEPNVGIAPVPDPRLWTLAEMARPQAVVPAVVEFTDIAGLVAGAAQGEGLGNRFLHHIRETDAIAHVVRCFSDPNVAHVSGSVDPVSDIAVVSTELALADLSTVTGAMERTQRRARAGDKEAAAAMSFLEVLHDHLATGSPARSLPVSPQDRMRLRDLFLLTAKPVLYVANVGEDDLHDSPLVARIAELARAEQADVVVFSGVIEAELARLDPSDRREMLAGYGLEESGLERVVRAAYRLLGLITFFTTGPKEVRAWPIRRGATAFDAAGTIHSDFQRGFIRAEVISFDDFVKHGGEQGAKLEGRLRLEGRDYVVADGDVIHFRFNV